MIERERERERRDYHTSVAWTSTRSNVAVESFSSLFLTAACKQIDVYSQQHSVLLHSTALFASALSGPCTSAHMSLLGVRSMFSNGHIIWDVVCTSELIITLSSPLSAASSVFPPASPLLHIFNNSGACLHLHPFLMSPLLPASWFPRMPCPRPLC